VALYSRISCLLDLNLCVCVCLGLLQYFGCLALELENTVLELISLLNGTRMFLQQ